MTTEPCTASLLLLYNCKIHQLSHLHEPFHPLMQTSLSWFHSILYVLVHSTEHLYRLLYCPAEAASLPVQYIATHSSLLRSKYYYNSNQYIHEILDEALHFLSGIGTGRSHQSRSYIEVSLMTIYVKDEGDGRVKASCSKAGFSDLPSGVLRLFEKSQQGFETGDKECVYGV